MRTLRPLLLFALLLYTPEALPQFDSLAVMMADLSGSRGGQTAVRFLTLPRSAAELTMPAGTQTDAASVVLTPANTAFFSRHKFMVSHLEWLQGVRQEFAAAVIPFQDFGTLGFFSHVNTIGNFENARDINEEISKPFAVEYAAGASAAKSFFANAVAAGVTLFYLESRLDDLAGRAFAGNASIAVTPVSWANLNLFVQNLGTPINYGSEDELLPLTAGTNLVFSLFPQPPDAKLQRYHFNIAVGAQKIADQALRISAATEQALGNLAHARVGYEYEYGRTPSDIGLSAGFGFTIRNYGIDFGWKNISPEFGAVWGLSTTMQLADLTPKTADDFYRIAERHFSKKRWDLCIEYANKALLRNPNMWKAHTLIARIEAMRRRRSGLEIALLYTGNTAGNFLPTPLNTGELRGGLARQAAALKQLAAQYPLNCKIDAGNIITPTTIDKKAAIAGYFYNTVKYDAIGLGENELAFGSGRFCNAAKVDKCELVGTNNLEAESNLVKSKIIKVGKHSIMVVSVIDPARLTAPEARKRLAPMGDILRGYLNSAEALRCVVRVCIVHASWEQLKQSLGNVPPNTIVLCGSLSQAFETPLSAGNALLLSPGMSGQYVGCLNVRLNEKGLPIAYENNLITLTDDMAADSLVSDQIQRIAMTADLQEQGIDEVELRTGKAQGVFPFISSRHGGQTLFLKVAGKPSEFPLTLPPNVCRDPIISRAAGKMLYLEYQKPPRTRALSTDTTDDSAGRLSWLDTTRPILRSMYLNGAEKKTILPGKIVWSVCFAPDGKWAYASASNPADTVTSALLRMTPDGKQVVSLLRWPGARQRELAVSADGRSLAFSSNREGAWQLYCCDSLGKSVVRISNKHARYGFPQFSANGKYLAFLSDQANIAGRMDLWVYDLVTGKELAATQSSNVFDYCWLDQGKTLLYSAGVNAHDLNTVDVASGETFKFIPAQNIKEYSESSPLPILANKKLKIIYTREYLDGQKKIFWANADGSDDRQLVTGDHDDWLR